MPPPIFPTYLLPAFSFPFRTRQTSLSSTFSESSAPSLSYSPRSSISTSPSSSPTSANFITTYQSFDNTKEDPASQINSYSPSPSRPTPQTPNRLFRAQPNTLKCIHCATDIAFASQIVSKGFTGRHGRAYLVSPPAPDPTPVIAPFPPTKQQAKSLINTRIGRTVNRDLLTGAHVVADVSCVVCNAVLGWKYVSASEPAQRYKIGKFILETKRVVGSSSWEDIDVTGEYFEEVAMSKEEENGRGYVVFDSEDEDECEDLFAGVWDAEVVQKRRSRKVNKRKKDDTDSSS